MRTRWLVLVSVIGALGVAVPITASAGAEPASQSLAFAVQPAQTIINQVITGSDINPAGPPIQVDVLNSDGSIDTTSSAPVTIALSDNPSGATLSGTLTVNAVNGVATFSNLSINKPGIGYVLLATSPGITSAASGAFNEVSSGVQCTTGSPCTTSTSSPTSTFTLTVPGGGTTNLTIALDVGSQLVCPGYTAQDPNWFAFLSSSSAVGKTVTYQVRPSVLSTETVGNTQFCLGAPYDFPQKGGGNAGPGTLPDGSSGFIGLLPNCEPKSTGPCVAKRSTTPDPSSPTGYDVVLTVNFPAGLAGDPYGRG